MKQKTKEDWKTKEEKSSVGEPHHSLFFLRQKEIFLFIYIAEHQKKVFKKSSFQAIKWLFRTILTCNHVSIKKIILLFF